MILVAISTAMVVDGLHKDAPSEPDVSEETDVTGETAEGSVVDVLLPLAGGAVLERRVDLQARVVCYIRSQAGVDCIPCNQIPGNVPGCPLKYGELK